MPVENSLGAALRIHQLPISIELFLTKVVIAEKATKKLEEYNRFEQLKKCEKDRNLIKSKR